MRLVTSNQHKLKEFKRFGLEDIEIEQGIDLKEVDSDKYTVCKYKALETGKGTITEDTSFDIEGEDIGVNIKWLQYSFHKHEGKKAVWSVVLGVNDGKNIKIYLGKIKGTLTNRNHDNPITFGFDSYFIPENSTKTLSELEAEGLKDNYSARKEAIKYYLNDDYVQVHAICNIPKWVGKMQQSTR